MTALLTPLDAVLGRFTMYRLVTVVLGALAALAMLFAGVGWIDPTIFGVGAMALTLVVIVVASLSSNLLIGRLVGARPHLESSLITALLLWFLYWPSTEGATLGWLAGIAVLAQASKYVIAVRGRHVVNPAAAGVVLSLLIGQLVGATALPYTAWWAANRAMFAFVLIGALLVLFRTRRLAVGLVFVAVAYPLTVWGLTSFGSDLGQALQDVWFAYPLVFFAGFMLSEPLTLPPRRVQQLAVAALAAVVFTWPLTTFAAFGESWTFSPFESTYEVALVVTGVVAMALRQTSRRLVLRERRDLGDDAVEYVFDGPRPLAFAPGQYVELDVPHAGVDGRGRRRMFSVVSVPGSEVVVATRHPAPGSSFKQAMAALEPGGAVRVTSVHGDFVWPSSGPILLVGAGIGVTPFVSQVRTHGDRDVVVVIGERGVQPYADDLAASGARIVALPADEVTADAIARAVPDLADRTALVSGRPQWVDRVAGELRGRAKRVKTDHFLGY